MPNAEAERLFRIYFPLMRAEYDRIGVTEEMDRYFTGSGGAFTEADCERELAELRAIPSGIGFDAYCERVGLDAAAIRSQHEEILRDIENHSPNDE